MRLQALLLALTASAALPAHAMSVDAKALARFDQSYVFCESKFPEMRGHRDEAYLSLWRVRADAKPLAELAAARKSPAYQAERAVVQRERAKAISPAASSPIEQQCQGLWAEAQKMKKARR